MTYDGEISTLLDLGLASPARALPGTGMQSPAWTCRSLVNGNRNLAPAQFQLPSTSLTRSRSCLRVTGRSTRLTVPPPSGVLAAAG
jgi:hypothetical protein